MEISYTHVVYSNGLELVYGYWYQEYFWSHLRWIWYYGSRKSGFKNNFCNDLSISVIFISDVHAIKLYFPKN